MKQYGHNYNSSVATMSFQGTPSQRSSQGDISKSFSSKSRVPSQISKLEVVAETDQKALPAPPGDAPKTRTPAQPMKDLDVASASTKTGSNLGITLVTGDSRDHAGLDGNRAAPPKGSILNEAGKDDLASNIAGPEWTQAACEKRAEDVVEDILEQDGALERMIMGHLSKHAAGVKKVPGIVQEAPVLVKANGFEANPGKAVDTFDEELREQLNDQLGNLRAHVKDVVCAELARHFGALKRRMPQLDHKRDTYVEPMPTGREQDASSDLRLVVLEHLSQVKVQVADICRIELARQINSIPRSGHSSQDCHSEEKEMQKRSGNLFAPANTMCCRESK